MNYKEWFILQVDDLLLQDIEDRAVRITAVDGLIESYIESTGRVPDGKQLERLTDYILKEELTNKLSNKVSSVEYPFLSETQLARRYVHEYSLGLAETYDVDGVNRAKPERRRRTAREERFIDKVSQSRGRSRNKQYRRDTSPGSIITAQTEPFVSCHGLGERWRDRMSCVYEAEEVTEPTLQIA